MIAQQLQTIQKAVELKKEKFDFEGSIDQAYFAAWKGDATPDAGDKK